MNDPILITYATQAGATAGVAEAISQTLTASGARVDVLPISAVADLSPYRAVVIGSAVHGGAWLPEATAFVQRNQDTLRHTPTALFQVCMMLAAASQQYRAMVPEWLAPLRDQLHPVADASFAGALLLEKYPRFFDKLGLRIFLAAIKAKPGDYRDWPAIQSWASSLPAVLVN